MTRLAPRPQKQTRPQKGQGVLKMNTESTPSNVDTSFTRARKGKACVMCRKRKMKCDCVHPVCGPCVRFNRERDCEYTGGDQRSRTEILEENIAILQARLQELELLGGSASSSEHLRSTGPSPGLTSPPMSQSGSPVNAIISLPVARQLIDTFLPYATDLGFFFHSQRFLSQVSYMFSSNPQRATNDALLSIIYLWGIHLSGNVQLKSNEATFLTQAVQLVSTALSQPSPNSMHLLQAELLLCNYFFDSGRFIEGRTHLGSAVSLAVTLRLHKIRNFPITYGGILHPVNVPPQLPEPADMIEQGERIQAFWCVYVMDKTWAVALGRGSLFGEDSSSASTIETPWPLTMEQLLQNELPSDYYHGSTVQRFLEEVSSPTPAIASPLALRAQAVSLLSRAVWLSSTESNQTSLTSLNLRIERFIMSLPSLNILKTCSPPIKRSMMITYMLAHLATVQLHIASSNEDASSTVKCLNAGKAIVTAYKELGRADAMPNPGDVSCLDPLLPVLLTASAQVMIIELTKAKINRALWQIMPTCPINHAHVNVILNEIMDIMRISGQGSILVGLQIAKVEQARTVGGV